MNSEQITIKAINGNEFISKENTEIFPPTCPDLVLHSDSVYC